MKKIFFVCIMVLAVAQVKAQGFELKGKALDYHQQYLPEALENFNHEKPFQQLAYWYSYADLNNDGNSDLVLANYDKSRQVVYSFEQGAPVRLKATNSNDDWTPLFYYYSYENINIKNDVTLKFRPLFIDSPQISKNRFTLDNEYWISANVAKAEVKKYNTLVFKPHVNKIKYVGSKDVGNKSVKYTFALTDAKAAKTMFRGYSDYQATPFAVPDAWLKNHDPLQFSRWLTGEKVKTASRDAQDIIKHFYGGRRILATQWLASCPINERHFYMVLFEREGNTGLVAMVCIAEGEVVSAYNDWQVLNQGEDITESGQSYDKELFFHAPQIMAMVAAPNGLELYVRWNSLEGIHYSILREVDKNWIMIQDDYQYLMAY